MTDPNSITSLKSGPLSQQNAVYKSEFLAFFENPWLGPHVVLVSVGVKVSIYRSKTKALRGWTEAYL
jgi:hypothetical protein